MSENEVAVRNVDAATGEILDDKFLTPTEAFSDESALGSYFTSDPHEDLFDDAGRELECVEFFWRCLPLIRRNQSCTLKIELGCCK